MADPKRIEAGRKAAATKKRKAAARKAVATKGQGGLSAAAAKAAATRRAREADGGETIQQLTVRLPKDMHLALRTVANAMETSINETVIRALADYLSDAGRREEVRTYIKETQEQFRVTLDKLKNL